MDSATRRRTRFPRERRRNIPARSHFPTPAPGRPGLRDFATLISFHPAREHGRTLYAGLRILPSVSSARVNVVGAGLAGCQIAIYLARYGCSVHIYEKRPDPRRTAPSSCRGVNLVLSTYSMRLLEEAGLTGLGALSLPLSGRMMHSRSGAKVFAQYGRRSGDEFPALMPLEGGYSISRAALNAALLNTAEEHRVQIHFEQAVAGCNPATGALTLNGASGKARNVAGDAVLGCDGISSVERKSTRLNSRH